MIMLIVWPRALRPSVEVAMEQRHSSSLATGHNGPPQGGGESREAFAQVFNDRDWPGQHDALMKIEHKTCSIHKRPAIDNRTYAESRVCNLCPAQRQNQNPGGMSEVFDDLGPAVKTIEVSGRKVCL